MKAALKATASKPIRVRAAFVLLLTLLLPPSASAAIQRVEIAYEPSSDFATMRVEIRTTLDGAELADALQRADADRDGEVTPAEVAHRWNASLLQDDVTPATSGMRVDGHAPTRVAMREDDADLVGKTAQRAAGTTRFVLDYAIHPDPGAAGHVLVVNGSDPRERVDRLVVRAPSGWSIGTASRPGEPIPASARAVTILMPDARAVRVTFVNDSLVDAPTPETPQPEIRASQSAPGEGTLASAHRAPGAEAGLALLGAALVALARRR